MVKEDHIINIIDNEFNKILKNINSLSKSNNNNALSQQKILFLKFYKNIELTKTNILLKIKNYFSNNKYMNTKLNKINKFTKIFHTQKRNNSQNISNFKSNINSRYYNNIFYSFIDGSLTDLKKNNSYLSPCSNKNSIKINPMIIDIKNIKTYKKNINKRDSNKIKGINNYNLNQNNSNIINNSYNINNNINSSEESDSHVKVIYSKKNNDIKNNFNYILNKSHSELKLRLKDKKNNYSSNKICHQKKKISLFDELLNIDLFNKDKNSKNLKIFNNTNTVNLEGKGDKNIFFSLNPIKNDNQNFWKKNKKKFIINRINLQKKNFNTKTEINNKKKKKLNFSSNIFLSKSNNKKNNNSFKSNIKKLNNNNHNLNIKICNNNINNNSINNNIDIYDDSINEKYIDLAKEITNFIDNLKNLQNSIIKKDSDLKKLKINFEMQKISLYKKAKKILDNSAFNMNNNNINESKLNISNNSKGLNSTTVKSDSLSYINNYFGNIKNSFSGILTKNNINNNDINTKELNLSIINLKKTIEDIKINDKIMNEQLKNEIKDLNLKLNEKEKIYQKINNENLNKLIDIYKNILYYWNNSNKNDMNCNVPNDKKYDWYIHKINEKIEIIGKEWKKINDNENNKMKIIEWNIIKEQLYKATLDMIKWLEPYMKLNDEENKKYILKLENDFKEYGIKQALNTFKSKIKELIYLLEINDINKNNTINLNNIIDKQSFIKLNSVLLNVQNNLIIKNEKKDKEIKVIKDDLRNALKLNNKIIKINSNYFPQEIKVFQEKYEYILSLLNAEQDKVNLLQNEYIEIIEGLIDYINNGNKIYIELSKMWNIKPKNKTNFELIEPDPSEMGYLSESDLLSNGSNKGKENLEKYKEELEQYKKVLKYMENKMNKYDNLFNNITNIVIKIVKNLQINKNQRDLFYSLFRMLNIKNEKIISFIN